eukprot:461792-Rhodomonas_salina.1
MVDPRPALERLTLQMDKPVELEKEKAVWRIRRFVTDLERRSARDHVDIDPALPQPRRRQMHCYGPLFFRF